MLFSLSSALSCCLLNLTSFLCCFFPCRQKLIFYPGPSFCYPFQDNRQKFKPNPTNLDCFPPLPSAARVCDLLHFPLKCWPNKEIPRIIKPISWFVFTAFAFLFRPFSSRGLLGANHKDHFFEFYFNNKGNQVSVPTSLSCHFIIFSTLSLVGKLHSFRLG